MNAPTPDPLIGQVIADRYHVTALVGEGGMGRVYVAEHVRMGRKSALKVMSPALKTTADAITRFNREAANASRINHPNVAAIYDFGETADGLLYLAMEFVEGETLHALVHRAGRLPVARAAQITRGAADALAAAHHLGIIHRDLKPDNIMLTRQVDGSDWVKVVDFGIAKAVGGEATGGRGGQTVTTIGVSLGTPEYMSPEQLAGEKLDHRTDIYSLGLVLFNMLTGDLPYPKLTSKETLVRRLTSPPATLAEVRPDVAWPASVQAVLDRALDPEPGRRYPNVAELGRDIVAAAAALDAQDPDRTVRVAPGDRVPSLAPTGVHPTPIPASKGLWIAAAVVLLGGGAYAVWHARRGTAPPAAPAVAARDSAADTTRADADTSHRAPAAAAPAPRAARRMTPPPVAAPDSAVRAPRDANAAAAVTDSADRAGITRALAEIRHHMQTAGRAVAAGRMQPATMNLEQARAEMQTLRDVMPNERMPFPVMQQLRQMGKQAMDACFNAARGDAAATERCRQFQLRLGRAARGRGGQRPRF